MRDPGNTSTLTDVLALLIEWFAAIPSEYVPRWKVTPVQTSRYRAQSGQVVRVDTTAGDVLVILPTATAANSGAEIWVTVIAGSNHAIVRDDLSTSFGAVSAPVSLHRGARLVSVGTHWELLPGYS